MQLIFKRSVLIAGACLSLLAACSKSETQISGTLAQASPLDRIEIIDASQIATLPLTNMGLDGKGNFSKTLKMDRSGVYVLSYNGRLGMIYLEKGEDIKISGQAATFPEKFVVEGAGKEENAFIQQSQVALQNYMQKYDQNVFAAREPQFLDHVKKIREGLRNEIDRVGKSTQASSEVIQWRKDEMDVNLLIILSQYAQVQKMNPALPNYTPSAAFRDYVKSLEKDDFLEEIPAYRQYLLSKERSGYEAFIAKNKGKAKSNVGMLLNYLKTKNDLSPKAKDYMAAFLATSMDLQPNSVTIAPALQEIRQGIQSEEVKKELERAALAVQGPKEGTEIKNKDLVTAQGKPTNLAASDKPQLVLFYASWNPYLVESGIPILKEIQKVYGSKVQLTLVNLDDTEEQFKKTASAGIGTISGARNLYAKGGLESALASELGIYGFKLPNAILLEKGKVVSPTYSHLSDPALIQRLNVYLGSVAAPIVPPAQNGPQAMPAR